MTDPALIAIAGEDHAHRLLACHLTDLALLTRQKKGWPEPEEFDQVRAWTGFDHAPDAPASDRFYRVSRLPQDSQASKGHRFRAAPRIHGKPAGHAWWFVQIYQLFAGRNPKVAALVVIDDADRGRSEDADAIRAEAYVRETLEGPAVAFGVAEPTAEGWLLQLLGQAAPSRPDDAKKHLREHLGLPVIPESPPAEHIAEALAPTHPHAAGGPRLRRFFASLRDHVAPVILP